VMTDPIELLREISETQILFRHNLELDAKVCNLLAALQPEQDIGDPDDTMKWDIGGGTPALAEPQQTGERDMVSKLAKRLDVQRTGSDAKQVPVCAAPTSLSPATTGEGMPKKFSDFIRNASSEEKEIVYSDVMQRATAKQMDKQTGEREAWVKRLLYIADTDDAKFSDIAETLRQAAAFIKSI